MLPCTFLNSRALLAVYSVASLLIFCEDSKLSLFRAEEKGSGDFLHIPAVSMLILFRAEDTDSGVLLHISVVSLICCGPEGSDVLAFPALRGRCRIICGLDELSSSKS